MSEPKDHLPCRHRVEGAVTSTRGVQSWHEAVYFHCAIPAFNEEDCIHELCSRLQRVFTELKDYDFDVILVENGSSDATFSIMNEVVETDPRFKIVQLSRNFRMDGGITAGLEYVHGEALILMTADLQDPPELIPKLVEEWNSGFENVYGVVSRRRGTGLMRRINSRAFYWLIGKLTGELIPKNASDFRILDKRVYEQIRKMDERNRFVRGLTAWVGFNQRNRIRTRREIRR